MLTYADSRFLGVMCLGPNVVILYKTEICAFKQIVYWSGGTIIMGDATGVFGMTPPHLPPGPGPPVGFVYKNVIFHKAPRPPYRGGN